MIYHTIRSTGQTFTFEQWCDHLRKKDLGEIGYIVTEYNGFHFNDSDICINPKTMTIEVSRNNYSVTLEVAECRGGRWSYGLNVNCGSGGFGFGCAWVGENEGYPTENDAMIAAVDQAIVKCKHSYEYCYNNEKKVIRLIEMLEKYRKELQQPKIVQLSLFDEFGI